MASLLIPATAATAQEDNEVSFVGAGWGHGVGLTQYGAYGAARDGWAVDQITGHFYDGSSIGTMGEGGLAEKENLWVNLERDRSTIELIARETNLAPPEPVVVTRGEETWELGKDHRLLITWNSGAVTCELAIKDASGEPIETPGDGPCHVDIAWDGWVEKPSRKIEIEGCFNTDWNLEVSMQRPCQYARGDLHLRVGPGGMDLSVEMDIDDYVYGISEMPYYWGTSGGLEALKAQALAARSYARNLQIARGDAGTNLCNAWCHVRDTTWDQRYVGWGHVGIGIDEWIEAVSATSGQVITHPEAPWGNVVRAYYSSSSGGATENVEEVWSSFSPVPYLVTAADDWSLDPFLNGNASWTVTRSAGSVASAVGLDTLTGVAVIERNTSTSAHTVRFTGTQDGSVVNIDRTGKWVDDKFGLKSIYFDVVFGEVGATSPFTDITGSVHHEDIVYIEDLGITQGCNPPSNTHYCPTGHVTRGEMAAFLVRALGLTDDGGKDWFGDDGSSVFESDINKLATAGITAGCNAAGTDFCPDQQLSRGEMAAFLVRGFAFTDAGNGDWFGDDNDSRFEGDIDRLKVAGVTLGCNPPDNTNYCPTDTVRRDQMASFLARALRGLA
ncbi:MAG: SpoIID/LytB domain-containing protein [bacterium]|nr:SpoIID/LytB domain-containing protein [bacterium]